ncbi:MAG: FixH family protein [Ignavibacteria bacterium]|jgi:hypothetical protein|nr:FixH family protein [Ignavibacteria bacterium]
MKISWGIKIIIVFAVFAAGIFTMVAVSMMNETDLVSENYYEQEIKYQDQIDLLNNSSHLNDKIIVTQERNEIMIDVSGLSETGKIDYEGDLFFYRSSDAGKDFNIPFDPDEKGIQKIGTKFFEKGYWKVSFKLRKGGEDFFIEKKIFVN